MRIEKTDSYTDNDMLVIHDDAPFTGEVVSRDADGRVIGEITYYEGIQHGPRTLWHPDGTKKEVGVVSMGMAVGDWRKWHANGQLAEHALFSANGRRVRRQRWDKDGKMTEDKSYSA